ncbi:MAG: hydroxyacid dehydrogenase, partial [Alphaproteobacteria bacterium]|nr:hydroxyacid dehydrogenase [Alphaproteobacteria bacterium]
THYALLRADAGREGSGLREIVEEALGQAFEDGLVLDATIADSGAQANALWRIREAVVEAQIPEGGSIKHDVSVPVSRVADFIEAADEAVARTIPGARPCPFGHVGDGNIHYNVSQPVGADKQAYLARWDELNAAVHDIVNALDGSVSAEHGVGRLKVEEITHYKPGPEIEMMQAVKRALDPDGLMNPGKVVM